MRMPALTILAVGMVSATAPARAQIYDPNYPVCMVLYSQGGGYKDCSYASLAQCASTASGRAAQCVSNPYFARQHQKPPGRGNRRPPPGPIRIQGAR